MKKISKLLLLSVLVSIIGFYSCSKTDSNFNIVPNTATMVLVFDGKQLSEKAGFGSFSESKTYQFIKSEVAAEEVENFKILDPILKNTKESGIDMSKDYFGFMYKRGEVNYIAMSLSIVSQSKFESTITKISKIDGGNLTINKHEKWSYVLEEAPQNPLIIWDDNRLVILMAIEKSISKEDYLAEASTLWDQKDDKSIGSNKDFSKFIKNKKDISMWMDYSIFQDNLAPMQKMLMQSNMPFDMAGTMLHFYTDFQKGKAVMSYNVELNDDMKAFMKENKMIKDKFDMAILEVLPTKSFANFSMAFDFLAYFEILKNALEQNQQSMDQIDQQFKSQTGMTIKEALNEFSGEMVFNVHRIEVAEVEEVDYMAYYQAGGNGNENDFKIKVKKPVMYYTVAAEMNNDKLFNSLIQNMSDFVEKTGDYYTIKVQGFEGFLGLFGKKLVFTNDKKLIEDVVDGKVDGPSLAQSKVADNLKSFPTYAFVDLDFAAYPPELKDALLEMMGEQDYGVFSNIISEYKMLEIKPKSMNEAEIILWMKDDSKNSLEVMLRSFDNNIEAIAE